MAFHGAVVSSSDSVSADSHALLCALPLDIQSLELGVKTVEIEALDAFVLAVNVEGARSILNRS